jgi:DNA-binding CsgD family transcriptional regulator
VQSEVSFTDSRSIGLLASHAMDACLCPDFADQIVKLFAEVVPGAVVSLDEIHHASSNYDLSHNLPAHERAVADAVGRLKGVFWQNPVHQYIDKNGPEKVLVMRDLATTTSLEKTEFYQDVMIPLKLRHQLAVRLDRKGWTCTLTLNRDAEMPTELASLLKHLTPALVSAHRVATEVKRLRSLANETSPLTAVNDLTPREWEVLTWMREGKRNSEIALILSCSERTIEKHVAKILRKTGTETRTAAARYLSGGV